MEFIGVDVAQHRPECLDDTRKIQYGIKLPFSALVHQSDVELVRRYFSLVPLLECFCEMRTRS